ncbi:protein-export chaperone SecB [Brevirhabdus pacifica]|uniref:Protein-export protein SecB n=1 Tax=Brevirhabdus pacifica TaxID=1267768 RepID=A0A1U7DIK7_9RHOB|nr:protein-export chaperone SecB [Brevirhabdus pacifica]APX89822.1 protein-export chaperone SecB [Brevirhabdus pacifica]OWU74452.1 preprotein translocase subunit SecB [Loktanella sp. 22II-4b]PJJ82968.1 preprotein translocase subunit SecB [Brevirhabdus pacifica]
MADQTENGAAGGNGAAEAPQVKMQIVGQFIRDMSFENVASQSGFSGEVKPEIAIQVNLDARKRGETQYEVAIKLSCKSNNASDQKPIFILEIDYAGVFNIENLPDEQLHPFLMIECPRMLFPYLRRVVSDVTRDGGFAPLNLEQIDFVALYRQELARRAQAESAGTA